MLLSTLLDPMETILAVKESHRDRTDLVHLLTVGTSEQRVDQLEDAKVLLTDDSITWCAFALALDVGSRCTDIPSESRLGGLEDDDRGCIGYIRKLDTFPGESTGQAWQYMDGRAVSKTIRAQDLPVTKDLSFVRKRVGLGGNIVLLVDHFFEDTHFPARVTQDGQGSSREGSHKHHDTILARGSVGQRVAVDTVLFDRIAWIFGIDTVDKEVLSPTSSLVLLKTVRDPLE